MSAAAPPPPDAAPQDRAALQVTLGALAEVFAPPPFDPLAGQAEARSGIERLAARLAGRPRREAAPVAVDWVVPAAEATGAHVAALRRAVDGWCGVQRGIVADEMAALAVERRQAAISGGSFFVICFALAAGFDTTGAAESLGIGLLTESLVIAGWVGLWHVVELVLYAPGPLKARRRVIDRIAAMEHRLVAG